FAQGVGTHAEMVLKGLGRLGANRPDQLLRDEQPRAAADANGAAAWPRNAGIRPRSDDYFGVPVKAGRALAAAEIGRGVGAVQQGVLAGLHVNRSSVLASMAGLGGSVGPLLVSFRVKRGRAHRQPDPS